MSASKNSSLGFGSPLHDPPNPAIDIVFVHGLGGGRESTWKSGDCCWPKDLLPNDIPDARISSFGYDSEVVRFWSNTSQNTLAQHATNLLEDIVGLRNDTKPNIPIIFVAHSLGGLLCVKCLTSSVTRPQERAREIAECTGRIAFLGTPFRGSDKAKWVQTGRRFISAFASTNSSLLKDIESKSDELASLEHAFHEWLQTHQSVEIMCFIEELGYGSDDKIVPNESGILSGRPSHTIHANHVEMCKFADKDDPGYKKVSEVLKNWAADLKKPIEAKDDQPSAKNISKTTFSGSNNSGNQFGQVNDAKGWSFSQTPK